MSNNLPEDFDPHYAIYALKSLAELMFEFHTEGPGVYRTAPEGAHTTVIGAAWLSRRTARELTRYLAMIDEAGIHLPRDNEGFENAHKNEIRETSALYHIN